MELQTQTTFGKLVNLLARYKGKLLWGGLCMIIYVGCWPLLAILAGELIPAIGKGDFNKVIEIIIKALLPEIG